MAADARAFSAPIGSHLFRLGSRLVRLPRGGCGVGGNRGSSGSAPALDRRIFLRAIGCLVGSKQGRVVVAFMPAGIVEGQGRGTVAAASAIAAVGFGRSGTCGGRAENVAAASRSAAALRRFPLEAGSLARAGAPAPH